MHPGPYPEYAHGGSHAPYASHDAFRDPLLVHCVSALHRIVLLGERDQICALQGLKERVPHYLPNSSGRSRRRSSTPCRASCAVFRGTVWCILGLGVPCIVLANGRRQGARFEYAPSATSWAEACLRVHASLSARTTVDHNLQWSARILASGASMISIPLMNVDVDTNMRPTSFQACTRSSYTEI